MDQVSQNLTVAFIKAQWHSDIVNQSYKGFVETIQQQAPQTKIDVFD